MSVRFGDWLFDNVDYDQENDVLYLSMGEPRPGHGEETPEGHIARFDEEGEFCGVTLIGVMRHLEKQGAIDVTLPRRIFPRREVAIGGEIRRLLTA